MPEKTRASLIERTVRNLRVVWQNIAGDAYDETAASLHPDLPDDDLERLKQQVDACLESRGGEVSARARAAALGRAYLSLNATGRERFIRLLAAEYAADRTRIDAAVIGVQNADNPESRRSAEKQLRETLVASRVKLFMQFNDLPEGIKFLVDMRAEILPLARKDATLKALELDLRLLLGTWFDVGFLDLQQITWERSPAALLEKLIAYEAVHEIKGWDDLKNRLAPDRRCFAYFHPSMPKEPLIFVEVALVVGMADAIDTLLDETAPLQDAAKANTAIFYSISNAQKGLAGISFGNFLIKRVVGSLSREFKGLKTFATLSPIPGFGRWLINYFEEQKGDALLPSEWKSIWAAAGLPQEPSITELLKDASWTENDKLVKALRGPLMRLCARYLMTEKGKGGRAVDPVAHFHLSNGAGMERLNWLANRSEKGLSESAGIMINYRYKLSNIDENHEAYTTHGEIAASPGMRGLLKK